MLNAYSKNNEVITLWNRSREAIEDLKQELYFCPACQQPVQIKNGTIKIPHFSHYRQNACQLYSEGETEEHLALKGAFANWCEQQSIPYELEKYLPDLQQRPDLLIGKIAIEIQCSPLSLKRLVERTQKYQEHGFIPIWICGKKLFSTHRTLSDLAKNLCYYSQKLGFYLWSADWETEELTLHFHMEEDWQKKLYAFKKSWSFYGDSLMEIFDFPNKAILYSQRKFEIGTLIKQYYGDLNKKLHIRNEQVRILQAMLYNNRLHLLQLPNWFYYPGIHIFCCRGSDILLKIRFWKLVQFFDQNVIKPSELRKVLKKELEAASELFHELPNISVATINDYCIDQVLASLFACGHIRKVQNGWQILLNTSNESIRDVESWIKRIENKYIITATPSKI